MKHCISIIEVLVKTVIVETNETGAESLAKAIACVKKPTMTRRLSFAQMTLRQIRQQESLPILTRQTGLSRKKSCKRKPISLYEKGFLFAIMVLLM